MSDELSLERIIPDKLDDQDAFDRATLQLHLERYAFAIQNGKPGRILDIACGTGYGAYQIIESDRFSGSYIQAVDISAEAIEYGKKRYANPAITYVCADAMIYTDLTLYDTIVSLETIEHLKDPQLFVRKLHALLKKDGILIVSAPVTPSTDGNPHHLTDFSTPGFRKLFAALNFLELSQFIQVQPYSLSRLFYPNNKRLAQKRRHLGQYYLQHPGIFLSRIHSLFRDGLRNKYLTLALQKR